MSTSGGVTVTIPITLCMRADNLKLWLCINFTTLQGSIEKHTFSFPKKCILYSTLDSYGLKTGIVCILTEFCVNLYHRCAEEIQLGPS